ncbi:CIS tube protein [Flexivirga alba]|uniref:LysM peptidoglycan-binding domain-containing protein n=1 Tax=Flexivirga alba TaxID=702742 RepID=A0ABW2AFU5_9MICO
MANLLKAKFTVEKKGGQTESIDVAYNPETLTFEKSPKFADIPIPGLDAPLRQFVRGQSESLAVELFFDTTDTGTGANATSVTTLTDKFYGLVKIDPQTHAPPVCTFQWGKKFPGDSLPEMYHNQRRTDFRGLVTKVKQDFSLFSPEGTPLRAVLTLSMEEYRPLDEQLKRLDLLSADHTRSHVVAAGDTVASIAWQYFDAPTRWRTVADANALDDPRRIGVGTALVLPPLEGSS